MHGFICTVLRRGARVVGAPGGGSARGGGVGGGGGTGAGGGGGEGGSKLKVVHIIHKEPLTTSPPRKP